MTPLAVRSVYLACSMQIALWALWTPSLAQLRAAPPPTHSPWQAKQDTPTEPLASLARAFHGNLCSCCCRQGTAGGGRAGMHTRERSRQAAHVEVGCWLQVPSSATAPDIYEIEAVDGPLLVRTLSFDEHARLRMMQANVTCLLEYGLARIPEGMAHTAASPPSPLRQPASPCWTSTLPSAAWTAPHRRTRSAGSPCRSCCTGLQSSVPDGAAALRFVSQVQCVTWCATVR